MDSLRLIDVLFGVVGGVILAFGAVLYGMLRGNAADVKTTAQNVNDERAKTAALVMAEKEKLAALVKIEHDRLEETFTRFRIEVAKEYATTTMVEKLLTPMINKLDGIEKLLHTKLDRREFEQQRENIRSQQ